MYDLQLLRLPHGSVCHWQWRWPVVWLVPLCHLLGRWSTHRLVGMVRILKTTICVWKSPFFLSLRNTRDKRAGDMD